MLTTIVAPDVLDAANHFTVVTKTVVPRPEMRSFYYRVPAGSSALKVELELQKRGVQLAMMRPDTRTATPQRIVATGGRGGGGGGGGQANLPKETYVITDPMPGIWEIRLTDTEDTRTFDWEAAEKGKPVPSTPATITVQALGVTTTGDNAGGVVLASSNAPASAGTGNDLAVTNRFAEFTGGVLSYPLGASRRLHPTIHVHEQQVYEIDVPAGSASLVARAGKTSDAAADLDIYVYDCSGKECRAAGSSADPVVASGPRDEAVTIQNPSAGKWKVVVDAAAVPSGSTTFDYLDVVFNQSFGMVGATDQPAKRAASAQWNVKTGLWTAQLPEGRTPYAALLLEGRGGPTERFNIGLLEVPLNRRVAEK
jgi:hypothetical protein